MGHWCWRRIVPLARPPPSCTPFLGRRRTRGLPARWRYAGAPARRTVPRVAPELRPRRGRASVQSCPGAGPFSTTRPTLPECSPRAEKNGHSATTRATYDGRCKPRSPRQHVQQEAHWVRPLSTGVQRRREPRAPRQSTKIRPNCALKPFLPPLRVRRLAEIYAETDVSTRCTKVSRWCPGHCLSAGRGARLTWLALASFRGHPRADQRSSCHAERAGAVGEVAGPLLALPCGPSAAVAWLECGGPTAGALVGHSFFDSFALLMITHRPSDCVHYWPLVLGQGPSR